MHPPSLEQRALPWIFVGLTSSVIAAMHVGSSFCALLTCFETGSAIQSPTGGMPSSARAPSPSSVGSSHASYALSASTTGMRSCTGLTRSFGGPVMIVFGILCLNTFLKRFRGQPASTFAPVVISIAYLAFSVWAAVITGGDPFFVIFVIPAVLLAIASIP